MELPICTKLAEMDLSIVVTTYGRIEHIKRLVEGCEKYLSGISFEIVVVASDDQASEKIHWLSTRPKVKLICVGDRKPGQPRQRSLYFYENLGIQASTGEWVFIINDDSEISASLQESFIAQRFDADILVVPAHIDNRSLGHRTPVIGTLDNGQGPEPLYLLDFAMFKRSVLNEIGPADEGFDWYGRGADMAISAALLNKKVVPMTGTYLNHFVELEQRNPPHYAHDFLYLKKKWRGLLKSSRLKFETPLPSIMTLFYAKYIWPAVKFVRTRLQTRG